jgi:hypothetical protein
MADIVIGIASSHVPQLSSGVGVGHDHAERDQRNPQLLGTDARFNTYSELIAGTDQAIRRSKRNWTPTPEMASTDAVSGPPTRWPLRCAPARSTG